MSALHELGIELQFINADRDPPSSRPAISLPCAASMDEACQECGTRTKKRALLQRALLRHVQRLRTPDGKPFLMIITDVPLCLPCAAAGRKRGWPALLRTWRCLTRDSAREFIENVLQRPVGGVQ